MTVNKPREFPRVNFVALLVAGLFLISGFLDWWGISVSGSPPFHWNLWNGPNTISLGSAQSAGPLVTYSPIIGAMVIAAAVLALLGTIPRISPLLIGSTVLSVAAPIAYILIVNDAISSACNGVQTCISGPAGSQNFGFGVTLTWGFQQGFYLEIIGAVLSFIAIAFQRTFVAKKS